MEDQKETEINWPQSSLNHVMLETECYKDSGAIEDYKKRIQ